MIINNGPSKDFTPFVIDQTLCDFDQLLFVVVSIRTINESSAKHITWIRFKKHLPPLTLPVLLFLMTLNPFALTPSADSKRAQIILWRILLVCIFRTMKTVTSLCWRSSKSWWANDKKSSWITLRVSAFSRRFNRWWDRDLKRRVMWSSHKKTLRAAEV